MKNRIAIALVAGLIGAGVGVGVTWVGVVSPDQTRHADELGSLRAERDRTVAEAMAAGLTGLGRAACAEAGGCLSVGSCGYVGPGEGSPSAVGHCTATTAGHCERSRLCRDDRRCRIEFDPTHKFNRCVE